MLSQKVPVSSWTVTAKTVRASKELQHLLETLNPGLGPLGLKSPVYAECSDSDWQTSPSRIW